jgi:hypothetical protein
VSAALTAFRDATIGSDFDEDDRDLHEETELFFWFDCFSVDEHATQDHPQSWWSSTFQQTIRRIGHTCMLFTPWRSPEPLRRAWCLWELYCTIVTGTRFSVCLGPAERSDFERNLLDDPDVVLDAFARIDVESAQAGKESDRKMILSAAREMDGGLAKLNQESIQRLREWVVHIAIGMVDKAKLGAVGVKFRSSSRLQSDASRSPGRNRLEMASVSSQLLGHDRSHFEQLLTVALFLSQLHEGLEHANKLHDGFISNFTTKLKKDDALVFRSKLLHAHLLWHGRWGNDLDQAANNKIALAEYEELVNSDVWEHTVPAHHPDRLRATTEWVETSMHAKRLQLTDENLMNVRELLQKAIDAYRLKEKGRQEARAKMLLARAIHTNARNMGNTTQDDELQMKHDKLQEALALLSEEVEPFFVFELGERHVSTTEVHEEIGNLQIELAALDPSIQSRKQKIGEANSLLGAVEQRRAAMLGEDHATVIALRKTKTARPRSSTGMEQLQIAEAQVNQRRQKSNITFQERTDGFTLPQHYRAQNRTVSARYEIEQITPNLNCSPESRRLRQATADVLEKLMRQQVISRAHRFESVGNGTPAISTAAMSNARAKLEKHTRRDILSKCLAARQSSATSVGGSASVSSIQPPPPLPKVLRVPRSAPPRIPKGAGQQKQRRTASRSVGYESRGPVPPPLDGPLLAQGVEIIQSMSRSTLDVKAQHSGCWLVWKLIYNNEVQRRAVAAAGGVAVIMDAAASDPLDARLQEAGCAALASLVIDAVAARDAASAGSVDLAIGVMQRHSGDAAVQSAALTLLANLSAI